VEVEGYSSRPNGSSGFVGLDVVEDVCRQIWLRFCSAAAKSLAAWHSKTAEELGSGLIPCKQMCFLKCGLWRAVFTMDGWFLLNAVVDYGGSAIGFGAGPSSNQKRPTQLPPHG
jgi:hypothetical protein